MKPNWGVAFTPDHIGVILEGRPESAPFSCPQILV